MIAMTIWMLLRKRHPQRTERGIPMRFTVIKKNSYQDSVSLMLLTRELSGMDGVNQVSVMMGTPANMDIFKNSGLYTDELSEAGPNDICIVVNSEQESVVDEVLLSMDNFMKNQAVKSKGNNIPIARSWDSAMKKLPDANLALLSIAGEYVKAEADKALDRGMNVFIFSDNVSVQEERQLKEKARDKNLLVMGPDCGTGILSGIPLAFANGVEKGNIGIIGASGTGIQEVSTLISRKGMGMSQVIGIGGRDLSEEIGGITAISAIDILAADEDTEILVFISKPPAESVKKKVIKKLSAMEKPVIAIFLGEKPEESEGNMQYAWTLEEAAELAVKTAEIHGKIKIEGLDLIKSHPKQRGIKGLYSGGTLASEAGMIMGEMLDIPGSKDHPDGVILDHGPHKVIDLGDDAYTKGRPHPMIDPTARIEVLRAAAEEEDTAIILLDFVIGYGGHENVSAVFAEEIKRLREELAEKGRQVLFIGSVTGTDRDPVDYSTQVNRLKEGGIYIMDSNAKAVHFAVKALHAIEYKANGSCIKENEHLILERPKVINVGLKHFAKPIKDHGANVVNFVWSPVAGGNKRLTALLEQLYNK